MFFPSQGSQSMNKIVCSNSLTAACRSAFQFCNRSSEFTSFDITCLFQLMLNNVRVYSYTCTMYSQYIISVRAFLKDSTSKKFQLHNQTRSNPFAYYMAENEEWIVSHFTHNQQVLSIVIAGASQRHTRLRFPGILKFYCRSTVRVYTFLLLINACAMCDAAIFSTASQMPVNRPMQAFEIYLLEFKIHRKSGAKSPSPLLRM